MKEIIEITAADAGRSIRPRPSSAHKGQCGRVLAAAGSYGMAGAAVLCTRSALRSGAGLVRAAVPAELIPVLQTAVPEATCTDIDSDGFISSLAGEDCVAAGCGMGKSRRRYDTLMSIMEGYDGPLVLDADGINCLCMYGEDFSMLKNRKVRPVLTPHPGEADRIMSFLGRERVRDTGRTESAEIMSEGTGCIVLLKGEGTVVSAGTGLSYVNTTGNPGMATGGSGDVLTGVIGAFLASGMEPLEAAKAGAFIHGLAGDIAQEKIGQWGMISSDICACLPEALRRIAGI